MVKKGVTYGVATAVVMILFFLLMKAVGLADQYHLRYLNVIFLFGGVYLCLRSYQKTLPVTRVSEENRGTFLKVGSAGLVMIHVTAILFAGFVAAYLISKPEFLRTLQEEAPMGHYFSDLGAAMIVFAEIVAAGFVFTYIITQWLKEKTTPRRRDEANEAERIKGR